MAEVTFTPEEIATFPKVMWFVGNGPPVGSFGNDNDLYLDGVTGDLYQKENGSWE